MSKRRCSALPAWSGLLAILLVALTSAIAAPPTHAAARHSSAGSDTLTLSMANGAIFTYGSAVTPTFTAVLVLATPFTDNRSWTVQVRLENGQMFQNVDPPNSSSDQLTYTFSIQTPYTSASSDSAIPPGDHTASATFDNYDTGVTTASNTINFTVTKASMNLACAIVGVLYYIWKPGQTEQIVLSESSNNQIPLDWTQGTATVTFVGPTTVIESDLQPNSGGIMTITMPSQLGWYALSCSFTGAAYYAAAVVTGINKEYLISEMSPLGGLQLYTNPTTMRANQATQMYIVFKAAPGLPIPTGTFNISIGVPLSYYTDSITIGANGTVAITLAPLAILGSGAIVSIHYFGDLYYNNQAVNFSGTNPPIPGNGGGSGNGGGAGATGSAPAKPSGTPGATPGATPIGSATASATARGAATPAPSPVGLTSSSAPSTWTGGALLLLALVILLVAGSGVGTFFLLSRRGDPPASPAGEAPTPFAPPPAYPYPYNADADTLPHRRIPDR